VDLNGQVRPVAAHDLRLAQARRLGFEPVIHPGKGGIATIADLQQKLFHRKQ
jgi:DNA repair protein RadA/Sms